jgi:hypothetical protein
MAYRSHDRIAIKVRLKKIMNDGVSYSKLYRVISDTNNLISNGYLFMRSFFLHVFENINSKKYKNISKLQFNQDFIKKTFSILNSDDKPKKGRPFNDEAENVLGLED